MHDKETEDGLTANAVDAVTSKHQGLFGSSGIQLTESELQSPAAVKFLRHLNSTQDAEIKSLRSYQTQYYDKRQECEVIKKEKESLEQALSSKKEMENLQKAMITVGSLTLGSLKLLENQAWYTLTILAVVAVTLILGGMFPVLRIGASK